MLQKQFLSKSKKHQDTSSGHIFRLTTTLSVINEDNYDFFISMNKISPKLLLLKIVNCTYFIPILAYGHHVIFQPVNHRD